MIPADLDQWGAWLAPFTGLWRDLSPMLPRVSAALVLLLAGLLVGAGARALARTLLRAMGVDRRLEGMWLFQIWNRSHRGSSPSRAFGNLAFYTAVFTAALLSLRALGAGAGDPAYSALLTVVPRIMSAVLILLLGALLAGFVSTLVQLGLAGSQLPHAVFWGKVGAWTTFGATVMFSLEPLGPAGDLLAKAMLIALAALGLAAGLAFGLGCKDLAREFLMELIREDKEP